MKINTIKSFTIDKSEAERFKVKNTVIEDIAVHQSIKSAKNYRYNPLYFHPSFGEKTPLKILSRAERFKAKYEEKELSYLLPKQVWTTKKIAETLKAFSQNIDFLAEINKLNKLNIQNALNSLLPKHAKNKIVIKDFEELAEDLRVRGYDQRDINLLAINDAQTASLGDKTIIYLKMDSVNKGKFGLVNLKATINHEVRHALVQRLKNIGTVLTYNNDYGKCKNQNNVFNLIFSRFEAHFNAMKPLRQSELSHEKMLQYSNFESIKAMHEKFESVLATINRESRTNGDLKIGINVDSWIQYFKYMKYKAKDEKEAYQANKIYRELYNDHSTPTNAEFIPMIYAEMEKFFAKKEQALILNKQNHAKA